MQLMGSLGADIDNIATFVRIVRGMSLASAARELGVPKSTVSRRLLRLEQDLDAKLVHRDSRPLRLTVEGRRFFDSVVGAIDDLELAIAKVEASAAEPAGVIRLTAPADLGRMVLIPHLVDFLGRYPDISIDLVLTNRFIDLVQEGVDLAVRAGAVTDPNLIARKLFPSELQLASHPNRVPKVAAIEELEAHPFVLYRAKGKAQVIRLESEDPEASVELTVSGRVNVDDYSAMVELVSAGHGIGLMPALHLSEAARTHRLIRIFPKWRLRDSHIQLLYPSRQLPERTRLLIDHLVGEQAPSS